MPDDVDGDALTRALIWYRARSQDRSDQLDHIIRRDGWRRVAEFCAGSAQRHHLQLRPWMPPPCWCELDEDVVERQAAGRRAASELLARMLAAGLSRYEPDPIGALREAESTCTPTAAETSRSQL
jgi:hypothetical protein